MQSDRIQRILRASREQFSKYGYSGARIDVISAGSHTNKRLVYEYCHTKEGLYLAVLSDVSREVMARVESEDRLAKSRSVEELYTTIVEILSPYHEFIRLWAWERLSPTIHGPRILETIDVIFDRIEKMAADILNRSGEPPILPSIYRSLKIVCAGYLIANAVMSPEENSDEELVEDEISDDARIDAEDTENISEQLHEVMSRGIGLAIETSNLNHIHKNS